MIDLSSNVLEVFRSHQGLATASMLEAAGLTRFARRRLLNTGAFVAEHQSVYRIASAPVTLESRCVSWCLAHPSGFITGPAAGLLYGLRRMPRNEGIVCAVPHGLHIPREPNVTLRQTTSIEAIDVVVHSSGLRIASPPRLGFDLSRDLNAEDHASVIEQMIERQMCTAGVLAMVGRRLTHPARRGSHLFVRTMMERHVGAPHESHPEMLVAAALKARGIPVVAQHPLYGVPGIGDIRFDLAVVEQKWAVEIDVHPSHVLPDGTTKDKRRDRACHRLGWQVERITGFDLLDLEGAADELLESYNIRVRSAA